MPTLPTRDDLVMISGEVNISQWADVDNDGSKIKKESRIYWAINESRRYVAGRLACRFDITKFVDYPEVIYWLIARRACIELYTQPRGLADGDPAAAQLNAISIRVEAEIDQILAGVLKLADLETPPISYPDINNSGGSGAFDRCYREHQNDGMPIVDTWSRFY